MEFRFEDLPKNQNWNVRALCIFIGADDYSDPVKVCYTHSRDSLGQMKSTIGESYKSFVRKWTLVKYQSQSELVEVVLCNGIVIL